MSTIQDHILEVTVVGCTKLKDTEWITKQDPCVVLQYGGTNFHTRVCRGGHRNPYFNEKFKFTLIEGLRELGVEVWNKRTLTKDDFIGRGQVKFQAALLQGYNDSSWALKTNHGRDAGEVQLIIHYTPLPPPPPPANCPPPAYYHPSPAYSPPPSQFPLSSAYPPQTHSPAPGQTGRLYPDVYPRY